MNAKRISGIILVVIGVLAISFSAYINKRVSTELGKVKNTTDTIQNNPVTEWGGKAAKDVAGVFSGQINKAAANKAAPYSTTAKIVLYSGIFLIVVGGLMTICCRKCSK